MLEKRLARLENILASLEPKISEILLSGAKNDDVQKLQIELIKVEGTISGVEDRLAGIEGRLSMIPTTWQTIAILAAPLIGHSGIIFMTSKFLDP